MTLIELMIATSLSAILLVALSGSITVSLRIARKLPTVSTDQPWHDQLSRLLQSDFESATRLRVGRDRMMMIGQFPDCHNDGRHELPGEVEYRLSRREGELILHRRVTARVDDHQTSSIDQAVAMWIVDSESAFHLQHYDGSRDRFIDVWPDPDRLKDLPISPTYVQIIAQPHVEAQTQVHFKCLLIPENAGVGN